MDAARFAQIDRLLDEALERAPEERTAFVAQACGADLELREEVESLLAAHAKAEAKFLQAPAMEVAAQQLAEIKQHSLIGRQFGRYQVLSSLGAGGMGEVYLGQDTKLSRKVALKFLPRQFTQDEGRVKRFIREAKTVSALNHPNIITVYEIGISDEEHFIATELVDGQTLRERLARGRVPLTEALEIALQIAAALEAAHDAGIVHRDIKPENVMLRRDGYVKVLDFGLAKLTERPGERGTGRLIDAGQTGTLRNPLSKIFTTQPGVVLGTVNYMSPEQSLGHDVDHRSDLFSLGIVLYELVAGKPPFQGDSTVSVLDAIAHQTQAPVTQFHGELPGELERILNRALEKDRDLRYQTAGDMRAVLKRLQRELNSAEISGAKITAPRPAPRPWWRQPAKLAGTVALVVLTSAAALWLWQTFRASPTSAPTDWSKAKHRFLTELPERENNASISPDGQSIVYSVLINGQWDIYQLRIGGSKPQNLTNHPASDGDAAYSPNGERIAFFSGRDGGGLYVMTASGENPRRLTAEGRDPDWSPDGQELVYATHYGGNIISRPAVGSQLWIVNLTTNEKRQLDAGPDAVSPRWSPHNQRIAFWGLRAGTKREIWTLPVQGGTPVAVTNDDYDDALPVWSPDGQYLYFSSNRNGRLALWRVALDEASGRTLAEPELVPTPSSNSFELSLAAQPVNGTQRLVYTSRTETRQLFRIGFDAARGVVSGAAQPITQNNRQMISPEVSPDGQRLVYYSLGDPQFNLFVSGAAGREPRQLTNEVFKDRAPRWSPDGQRLVFYSDRTGKYEIWTIREDGSELRQVSFSTPEQPGFIQPSWSPDNQWLALSQRGGASFLFPVNQKWPQGLQILPPATEPGVWFMPYNWSADSQKLVGTYRNQMDELPGLIVYDLPTRQYRRLSNSGSTPFWLRDQRHLLASDGTLLLLVDSQTGATRKLLTLPNFKVEDPVLSPDEKWLYYSVSAQNEDIWLMTF